MSGTVRIAEVNIDMSLADGSYMAVLMNINGASELSEVESFYGGETIPQCLREVADRIEAAARREFDPRRKRPGT